VLDEGLEAINEWDLAAGRNVFETPGEMLDFWVLVFNAARHRTNHKCFDLALSGFIQDCREIESAARNRNSCGWVRVAEGYYKSHLVGAS
jgi:hypothetical protein